MNIRSIMCLHTDAVIDSTLNVTNYLSGDTFELYEYVISTSKSKITNKTTQTKSTTPLTHLLAHGAALAMSFCFVMDSSHLLPLTLVVYFMWESCTEVILTVAQ